MLNQIQISLQGACSMARRHLLEGDHSRAVESLFPFWDGLYSPPKLARLTAAEKVELLTICGRVTTAKARATQAHGLYGEAEKLFQQAIRLADDEDLPLWEVQDALAHCYWRQGNYKAARKVLEVARAIVGTDQTEEYVYLTATLCIVECMAGKPQTACNLAEEVADLAEGVNDPMTRARFYDARANALNLLGLDHGDEALLQYTGAGVYFEIAGHHRHVIAVENNIANLLIKMGRAEAAHEHLNRVYNYYLSISDRSALGQTLETRAQAFISEGRLEDALAAINQSLAYLEGDEKGLLAESQETKQHIMSLLNEKDETVIETLDEDFDNVRFISAKVRKKVAALANQELTNLVNNLLQVSGDFLLCRCIERGDVLIYKPVESLQEGDPVAATRSGKHYVGMYHKAGYGFTLEPCCADREGWDFSDGSAVVVGKVVGYIKQPKVRGIKNRIREF